MSKEYTGPNGSSDDYSDYDLDQPVDRWSLNDFSELVSGNPQFDEDFSTIRPDADLNFND